MITQKELIQRGWVYNGFTYRENGEANHSTAEIPVADTVIVPTGQYFENGDEIFEPKTVYRTGLVVTEENIIKTPDKVEEYVKQYFKVDYWGKDAQGADVVKTLNVFDLAYVKKLDVIVSEKRYFAFIIDTKDGYKVQIKHNLNTITPTEFSTEDQEDKFAFSYDDLKAKFNELLTLSLD